MSVGELEAVYFPGWYPLRDDIIAAACVYFTRVHFVTPIFNAESSEAYTEYLRASSKKNVTIHVFGKSTERTEPNIQRMAQFWRFIRNSGELLGEVIHYHPSLVSQEVSSIVGRLCGGGLPVKDLLAFLERGRKESEELAEMYRGTRVLDDDFLPMILPTARYLAIRHGWIPLSDDPNVPAPVLRDLKHSADELSASLAIAILTLALPAPQCTEPDLLLQVREEMKGELHDFRLMVLKLAADLRNLLSESPSREQVQRETDFLVKTKIMPYVADIRRKTQVERGRFWRRVFGKTPKWLSLGLACFNDPTGAALATALREASKDAATLLDNAHRLSLAGDPGVALLIRIEDIGGVQG